MSKAVSVPEETGKWRQFIATILVNVSVLGSGVSVGWNSPILPHLQSPETSVGTKPMTDDETSWLSSALPLGALTILPFCSGIAERFGRKNTGFFIAAPLITCWLLTLFANSYAYLLVARFLAGAACAVSFFLVPIYVSEIADTSVRGLFGSLLLFSFRIGIVGGYIIGTVVSYHMFAVCGLVIPVVFLVSFMFMPETPIHLVRKGKLTEAKRSLMWYKNNNKLIVEDELRRLQALNKESLDDSDSVGFRDLFRDRGTTRAFIIAVGLVTGQELSGISPMLSYTANVFKSADISMPPNHAAIVVGGVQLLGSWLSTMTMERLGRRKLLFISCLAMALCHTAFGLFSLIKSYGYDVSSLSGIPVVALATYGVMYCLGMGPVPFVIMSEIFSADILSFASSVVMALGWSASFIMTKFFPPVIDTVGFHGCFLMLAGMCIYILGFTYFLVPETKGRSIESITKELNDGKRRKKKEPFPEAAVEMITKSINTTESENKCLIIAVSTTSSPTILMGITNTWNMCESLKIHFRLLNMKKTGYQPEPGKLYQFIAAIVVNIMALSNGIVLGWSSPVLPQLQTPETPIGSTPMTTDHVSWLNGVLPLGALTILPFCSVLTERLGRKLAILLGAVPAIICWLLKVCANSYIYLLLARYAAGMSMAMLMLMVPLYIAEISADSIRGQLGCILVFAVKIGIVMGYSLGAALSYRLFAVCGLMVPIIFIGLFVFMPETPTHLVRKGLIDRATKSLMWLRNNDRQTVDRELLHLQSLVKECPSNKKSVGFRDLFRDRGTTKGFIISLGLLCGQQTCGIFVVSQYTAYILQQAESSLKPNTATIIIGIGQIVGSCLSTLTMERAGRRSLIFISCAGMAMSYCTISGFLFLKEYGFSVSSFGWIPVVALSFWAIVYCVGMSPAPLVVASEVFSPDISSFANSVSMVFMWICAFLIMKYFPIVKELLGLDVCFILLASFCMATFAFTYFLVPETKGRNIESILDELNGCSGGSKQNGRHEAATEMITIDKKITV
ncbi:uncharacterized protein LOC135161817 [Diachasmimorpha longicaudata]|uniref:uncharacterized protein LOC135161817 n=1 Tax=Diachasmimorpha longicaudata TaxID=58733 RepID=UPI0030B885B8